MEVVQIDDDNEEKYLKTNGDVPQMIRSLPEEKRIRILSGDGTVFVVKNNMNSYGYVWLDMDPENPTKAIVARYEISDDWDVAAEFWKTIVAFFRENYANLQMFVWQEDREIASNLGMRRFDDLRGFYVLKNTPDTEINLINAYDDVRILAENADYSVATIAAGFPQPTNVVDMCNPTYEAHRRGVKNDMTLENIEQSILLGQQNMTLVRLQNPDDQVWPLNESNSIVSFCLWLPEVMAARIMNKSVVTDKNTVYIDTFCLHQDLRQLTRDGVMMKQLFFAITLKDIRAYGRRNNLDIKTVHLDSLVSAASFYADMGFYSRENESLEKSVLRQRVEQARSRGTFETMSLHYDMDNLNELLRSVNEPTGEDVRGMDMTSIPGDVKRPRSDQMDAMDPSPSIVRRREPRPSPRQFVNVMVDTEAYGIEKNLEFTEEVQRWL